MLDIDAHHGNGTQGAFWQRDDVFFVSVHVDPNDFYPWFVGHAAERGAGAGEGATLNLPLPLGSGDEAWLGAIACGAGAIRRYRADALVLSLGFDASRQEPLAGLAVSEEGFARAGRATGGLGLPTAIVQEGGYNTDVMGRLLTLFLSGFMDASAPAQ